MSTKVTESQKRTIVCPECCAMPGKPCKGSRTPGPNTFGGGWGGPPALERAHNSRRTAYLAKQPITCRACNKTLVQCNAEPECSETNNYEHDIPGHHMVTTLTPT